MSDNNNEYSTGFGGFDMPDFDSFQRIPTPQEQPTESVYNAPVDDEVNVISETEEPGENVKQKKSKFPFAAVCVLLIISIIACCTVTVLGVSNFLKPDNEAVDDTGYNAYTELVAKYSSTKYPSGITPEMAKVYAANNDVVGWLYIPGTNVNTPIVQAKNNEQYLRNNFYGTYTNYGTAYADYHCNRNNLSKNTIIYGHNMPAGTHFYDVNRYEDIEWYKRNPIIKYSTLNQTYTFLIYTAFYSTVNTKDDGGYMFNYVNANMSDSNFKGYIEQLNQRALYKTDVTLSSTDKIITLSTCNHTYDRMCGKKVDSRLVVVGRLLHEGESENVDTSKAKSNPDYRKPQVWYDKKGKKNPYASSRTWYPSSK